MPLIFNRLSLSYQHKIKGVAWRGPEVHVTPLCKSFCRQTTYNIQVKIWWVLSVWLSVNPPLKNPGYANEDGRTREVNLALFNRLQSYIYTNDVIITFQSSSVEPINFIISKDVKRVKLEVEKKWSYKLLQHLTISNWFFRLFAGEFPMLSWKRIKPTCVPFIRCIEQTKPIFCKENPWGS